jgi:hypothetical protein
MLSKAVIRPISPSKGWEGFFLNLDLDTVADAATILRNIENVISKSKVGKAEIAAMPHDSPFISTNENIDRVVERIRNDSEKVFSRPVFIAIRDGHEPTALSIIRKVVPNVAKEIRVELSDEDLEKVAQIILERARGIQQKGEWEGTLKWLAERRRSG